MVITVACSGSSGRTRDAAAPGTRYPCPGVPLVTADAGVDAAADAGATPTCVVGQTFCVVQLPHPPYPAGTPGEPSCQPFAEGLNGFACAQDPSCACFTDPSRGGFSGLQCRCSDTNGLAVISCEQDLVPRPMGENQTCTAAQRPTAWPVARVSHAMTYDAGRDVDLGRGALRV